MAKLTYRQRSRLPESAFLLPKYRKLPYKNANGIVSLSHVRNALARASQVQGVPQREINAAIRKAETILLEHGGYENIMRRNTKMRPNFFKKKPLTPAEQAEKELEQFRKSQVWRDKFRYFNISEGMPRAQAQAMADESTREYWARKKAQEGQDVAFHRNPSRPGTIVYHAKTRGGKYELIAKVESDGSYLVEELTNGKSSGRSVGHDLASARRKIQQVFRDSRDFDGINYTATVDQLFQLSEGVEPRRNGRKVRRNGSSVELYAQPYDMDGKGFYFSDLDDYEEKYAKEYKRHRTEEYEIMFIDGDDAEGELFKAMEVSQASLGDFFEALEELEDLDDDQRVALLWLMDDRGYSDYRDAIRKASDVYVFEGRPEDYVYELLDDIGISDDIAQTYFDYDKFGRDLSISGDLTRPLEEDAEMYEQDGDEEEAERLRDEIERLESLSDEDLAYDYVESIGSLQDALGKKVSDYFDYEAFARDMDINGEIDTFRHEGSDYVITNASEF